MAIEDILPDGADAETIDINDFLAGLRTYEGRVRIALARQTAGSSFPFLAEINHETTDADVKKAFGGGRYRVEIRAKQKFGKWQAGGIMAQKTFEIEGDPIRRRASTIQEALEEAERNPEGLPSKSTALAGVMSTPSPTPQSGSLDIGQMFASMTNLMVANMSAASERAAEESRQSRELLLAMIGREQKQTDPWEQLKNIREVAKLFAPAETENIGAAIIAGLPAVEPIIDRLMSKWQGRQRPQLPQRREQANGAQRQAAPQPPADAGRSEPTENPMELLGQAIQTIRYAVRDPECNVSALANVVASMLGDEVASAVAEADDAAERIVDQFPDLADHRGTIDKLHAELRELYAPEDAEDGQPATSDASEADGVRPADATNPQRVAG